MKNYLKIKPSKIGNGVFTDIIIPGNSLILEFKGNIYSRKSLNYGPHQYLQIGNDSYQGPSGEVDDYINHSCDPNCFLHIVGNRAFLYSLHQISENGELTFDYSTSSTESHDEWCMKCCCSSMKCRKDISGYQYLNEELKNIYKNKGLLPLFITDKMFQ